MPNDKDDKRKIKLNKDLKINKNILGKDLKIDKEVDIEKPVSEINIVLTKEQINDIVKDVLGPNGEKFDPRAISAGNCCVDASVGSSVAGPVSSVGSSVSVIGSDELRLHGNKVDALKGDLQTKLDSKNAKINIKVPKDIKIK